MGGGGVFGDEGDELAEGGGGGVVLGDVGLGKGAVLRVASGDEEGDMQIGTGVGGCLALAEGGDGAELVDDSGGEAADAFFVALQMGADEHEGEEMALHGAFLIDEVAIVEDGLQHGIVLLTGGLGAALVDTAAEDVEELLLCRGDA